jgi:hypothetical protein
MSSTILFRNSYETEDEFLALKNSQFVYREFRSFLPKNTSVIGRYSVLPFYSELYHELLLNSSELINNYLQHLYVADINNWYHDLKDFTPKTYFDEFHLIPKGPSYVVKGHTNSRKFQWDKQMFAESSGDVTRVVSSLLDDTFIRDQGICVREYIPLVTYDIGLNNLPITNEWRFFCFKNKGMIGGYYWSNYSEHQPYPVSGLPKKAFNLLSSVIEIVSKSINFFVIDIAETQDNEWIVIELNDGQMSGLSCIDPNEFYAWLYHVDCIGA